MSDIVKVNAQTGKIEKRSFSIEEKKAHEGLQKSLELGYADMRRAEYPPEGDAHDIAYKQRQKARMKIGKARAALENGDLSSAIEELMEAVEPLEDAKDYDGQVSATKKKYPKPDADQGGV